MQNLSFKITRNSIAYAFSEDNKILDAKVHAFPIAYNPKDSSSLQKERADLRSTRIRIKRKNLLRRFVKNVYVRNKVPLPSLVNNPWQLRVEGLDRLLSQDELYTVFYHLTKIRGYKSNRLEDSIGDAQENQVRERAFAFIDSEWDRVKYPTFGTYMYARGRTPQDFPTFRNKIGKYDLSTKREWIEQELLLLLHKQKQFGNPILTDDFCEQMIKAIISQRPLRSVREFVRDCPLMPEHKVATLSGRTSYVFTFWVKMNNLKAFDADGEPLEIPHEKKQWVLHHLLNKKTLKYTDLSKILDFPSTTTYNTQNQRKENDLFYSFENYYLFKKFLLKTEEGKKCFDIIDSHPWLYEKVSKVLSYIYDEEEMRAAFRNINFLDSFSDEFINSLISIVYFKGTHAFSHSAMEILIGYMEKGEKLRDAIKIGKFIGKFRQKLNSCDRELKPFDVVGSPIVARALSSARKIFNSLLKFTIGKNLTVNLIMDRSKIPGNINAWMFKEFASALREQYGYGSDNLDLKITLKKIELSVLEKDIATHFQDITPLFDYSFTDDLKHVLVASQVAYFNPERYTYLEGMHSKIEKMITDEYRSLDPNMSAKEKAIHLNDYKMVQTQNLISMPEPFSTVNKEFIKNLFSKRYVHFHEDRSTTGEAHLEKYLRVENPSDDLIYINQIKEINGVRVSSAYKRISLTSLTLEKLKNMVGLKKKENLDLFLFLKQTLMDNDNDPAKAFPEGWVYHPSLFKTYKNGRKIFYKVYGVSLYDFSSCLLRVKKNLYANISTLIRVDMYSDGESFGIIPQYAFHFLTKKFNNLSFVNSEIKELPSNFKLHCYIYKNSLIEVVRESSKERKVFKGYARTVDVFGGTTQMVDAEIETTNLQTGEVSVEFVPVRYVKLDTATSITVFQADYLTNEPKPIKPISN